MKRWVIRDRNRQVPGAEPTVPHEPPTNTESLQFGAEPENVTASAMPDIAGWAESVFNSIRERIGERSMDEYLRKLNSFRAGSETDG